MLTYRKRKEIRKEVKKLIYHNGLFDEERYLKLVEDMERRLKKLIELDCMNPEVTHDEHYFLAYWLKIESITYALEYASNQMRWFSSSCESRWASHFINSVMSK